MCFSLFSFLKWNDDPNLLKIIILCYLIVLVISIVFMLCEPGHFCTTRFQKFEDTLGQCDWYALPIELQIMYTTFLSETQNPVNISSYGGIVCGRETSKKVFNP